MQHSALAFLARQALVRGAIGLAASVALAQPEVSGSPVSAVNASGTDAAKVRSRDLKFHGPALIGLRHFSVCGETDWLVGCDIYAPLKQRISTLGCFYIGPVHVIRPVVNEDEFQFIESFNVDGSALLVRFRDEPGRLAFFLRDLRLRNDEHDGAEQVRSIHYSWCHTAWVYPLQGDTEVLKRSQLFVEPLGLFLQPISQLPTLASSTFSVRRPPMLAPPETPKSPAPSPPLVSFGVGKVAAPKEPFPPSPPFIAGLTPPSAPQFTVPPPARVRSPEAPDIATPLIAVGLPRVDMRDQRIVVPTFALLYLAGDGARYDAGGRAVYQVEAAVRPPMSPVIEVNKPRGFDIRMLQFQVGSPASPRHEDIRGVRSGVQLGAQVPSYVMSVRPVMSSQTSVLAGSIPLAVGLPSMTVR